MTGGSSVASREWASLNVGRRPKAAFRGVVQSAAMLELNKVNEVVNKAASAILKRQAGVQRVVSEPALDSQGREALHITIVLKRGSADKISGDKALDTLVGIERALREAREERFPIIGFVTEEEEELESSGDTES